MSRLELIPTRQPSTVLNTYPCIAVIIARIKRGLAVMRPISNVHQSNSQTFPHPLTPWEGRPSRLVR